MEYLALIFGSIFLSNILLASLVGFPSIDNKTNLKQVLTIGLKTIVVTLVTTIVLYPIYTYLLKPEDWIFLTPLLAVLISLNVNIVVNLIMKKFKLQNYDENEINLFVPINAVIITSALLMVSNVNYLGSIAQSVGLGLGYTLVLLLAYTIKPRLNLPGVPQAFKGIPLLLITLGLIGMVFVGLGGIL